MLETLSPIICVFTTIIVIWRYAKLEVLINKYKASDWEVYLKNKDMVGECYSSINKMRKYDQDNIIDLGVRIEQIEKNMKELEKHVFAVMKSTLYKGKNK